MQTAPTGMERAVYYSKSFIIALALLKRHLTVEDAALASQVEVNSQIELWGEVEDSELFISIGHASITLNEISLSARC